VEYVDFELEIGAGRGREYPVAVLRSPVGEARGTMRFPFNPRELDRELLKLENELLRSGGASHVRRGAAPDEAPSRDFGESLFGALFAGDVRNCYEQSLRQVHEERRGTGLRLKLRFQAPELAALPWEFLYDPREGEYVCLQRRTPVVRYLSDPRHPPQPLAVTPPLRVLGLIASPRDLDPLDVTIEKGRIEAALKELRAAGRVELVWAPGQTAPALQTAMFGGPWHVFHFIGHGGFDTAQKEGLLAFANDAGNADWLSATQVARLLDDHDSLRLVVLNACEGARGDTSDLFSSTAATLVRRGVPAVLAMQYPISDTAAVQLSGRFYETLAYGLPVDAAVAEARITVSVARRNTAEWVAPVLYTRSPDGKLFDIAAPGQVDPLAELWERARAHLDAERWREAAEVLQTIVALQPTYRDAAARLDAAQRRAQLAEQHAAAEEALQEGSWAEAAAHLGQVLTEDPGYRDAAGLLERAERQQHLERLYAEARELHRRGDSAAVVAAFERIRELDDGYPDPDGLLVSAREAVSTERALQEARRAEDAGRQERLRRLYVEAEDAVAVGNWPRAVERLEALLALDGSYRDAAARLVEARREAGLLELYAEARQHHLAQEWSAVVDTFAEIHALDPAYPDDDGLLETARAARARVERDERLAARYDEAGRAAQAGDPDRAVQLLEEILRVEPGHRDAAALLARMRPRPGWRLGRLAPALVGLVLLVALIASWRPLAALFASAASPTPIAAPRVTAVPNATLAATAPAAPTAAPKGTVAAAATPTPVPTLAATPTARTSPIAAATPTPVWSIYAQDNFDKPTGLLDTVRLDSVGLVRAYEDRKYVLRKLDPTLTLVLRARLPDRYADARLLVDANLEGDPAGRYVAISCRDQWESDQDTGEQLSGYGLMVEPGRGRFLLARWDKSKETPLRGWEAAPAIRPGNRSNSLELSCVGTTIAARVNGTQVASVDDGGYRRGRFWIGAGDVAGAAPGPTEVRFDNMVVSMAQ
jgi:tetratricopeptide (TPR) repeat protein